MDESKDREEKIKDDCRNESEETMASLTEIEGGDWRTRIRTITLNMMN